MHHDKKTQIHHQDILIRRGFNIPNTEAIAEVDETDNADLSNSDNADQETVSIKQNAKKKTNPKS